MRYLSLLRMGLLSLLVVPASTPLHAETFHTGKARDNFQNAGSGYPEQSATVGAASHAAFLKDEASGRLCERDRGTTKLRALEAKAASVRNQVDALAQQWKETKQGLKPPIDAIQPVSMLIERLSLYPVETLLTVPASPDAYLHGILILQGFASQMQRWADVSQRRHADLEDSLAAAKAAQAAVDVLGHDIAAAHEACAAAEAAANTAARHAAEAVTQSNNLLALAAVGAEQRTGAKLGENNRNAPTRRPVEQAEAALAREAALAHPSGLCAITPGAASRTRLQPPVHGVIVKGWGETTDAGPATGVSYQAVSGARVVSPCGGRVVFANSFRSYGQLLILDCGGGYHIVLSGP